MSSATTSDKPRLWNVIRAAQYTGLSRNTFWKLVKAGDVPHVRIGNRVLIDQKDLEAFIDAHRKCGISK